jgi:hypothetical protein
MAGMISPHQIISTTIKRSFLGERSFHRARLSTRYMDIPQNTARNRSAHLGCLAPGVGLWSFAW